MTLKNHSPLLENPPSVSSASEEEEEEREVEVEEEVNSEEEEESDHSEEDGDDDEETEKSRFYVVPNSKPKSKDAEEENSDDDLESAPKRQVEAEKSKKRRKKKNDANAGEESEKKPARVWTEEGEIILLKGMANYYIKKGKRPNSDSNGFYEVIKGSINNDVSKDQLANKIRHARLRYLQNEAKEKSGQVLSFSKPHFEKCYELSKTIWGGEKQRKRKQGKDDEGETTGGDGVTTRKSKSKKLKTSNKLKATVEKEEEEGFGLNDLIKFKEQMIKPPTGLESFLNRGASQLIGPSRRKAFEKKWKELQVEETELFLKRIDLVREYSSMVFEALKSPPTS